MLNQSIRRIPALLLLAALAALVFASQASAMVLPERSKAPASEGSNIVPGHYIVVLKDSVKGPAAVAEAQVEQRDGELGFVYRHALKGYSAELSKVDAKALRKDPRVKYVDPVRRFEIASQTTPTGIDRIFATANEVLDIDEEDDVRIDVDVAVIDTGIDFEHPDLNVAGRTNCVPPGVFKEPLAEECIDGTGIDNHGHGTHVAGTIGAIDNGEGVVGVAPGARLWAVKVLTPFFGGASGTTPWIVAGIDWVTATREDEDPENDIEVANMSLGGEGPNPAFDEAVEGSVEAGVVYVVAAGNNGMNGKDFSPASSPDVITVSALADYDGQPDSEGEPTCSDRGPDDTLANFSNWGKDIEIAAPGACILSTLPGNKYGSSSGTSMASPHVAGAAAVLASESKPQSAEDVEAIRQELIDEASLDWSDISKDLNREPLLYMDGVAAPVEAATEITSKIGIEDATLNGSIEARDLEGVDYWFEYGTTTSYGENTAPQELPNGLGYTKVNMAIEGLSSGTTYHYRLVVESPEGTMEGEDRTFATTPWSAHAPPIGWRDSLKQISCASGSECIAVGTEAVPYELEKEEYGVKFEYYDVPLAYRWSGGKWERLAAQNPGEKGHVFNDVSCASTIFCMAVGEGWGFNPVGEGEAWSHIPWTQRWDGSKWSVAPIEIPADAEPTQQGSLSLSLNGISCASATSCVAVGKYPIDYGEFNIAITKALIEVWNGEEWQAISPPSEAPATLASVSCPVAGSCVALGGTKALRLSEGEWSTQSTQISSLSSVSCAKANSCIAAGDGVAAQWNGKAWSTLPSPEEQIWDLSCPSHTWCLAAGREGVKNWDAILGEWVSQQLARPLDGGGEEIEGWPGELHAASDVSCLPAACMEMGESVAGASSQRLSITTARTEKASSVTPSKATLNGAVNPHGGYATTYQFEYGPTTAYGTKVPLSPKSVGSGIKDVKVSESIESLKAGTTYHFRVVATGSLGSVYGEDLTFTTPAPPTASTGSATNVSAGGATLNGTVNPKGLATTYQFEYGTTTAYEAKVPASPKTVGSGGEDVAVSEPVAGLKPSTTYHYRVVATNAEGIVKGEDKTFATKSDPRFLFSVGKWGSENGQFNGPAGIAFTSEGSAWIVDSHNHRVQKFNAQGEYLAQFGKLGTGDGQLKSPQSAAIDASGNLWVADTGNNRIQKFNSSGVYQSQFGKAGSANGQFSSPYDVAIDASGNLWVADTGNNRIQKFNAKGEYLAQTSGAPEGLNWAYGIATDASGNLWVADYGLSRVLKFNSKGEYQSQFGEEGSANGQFILPYDVVVDAQGNLWVTDQYNSRVQKFTPGGEYMNQFGSYGTGAGQMEFPTNVAIDAESNLWVSDQGIYPVEVWKTERPSATTDWATGISESGATLYAFVNPNGLATTYRFEYGTTTSYGQSIPIPEEAVGSGTNLISVKQVLSGLKPSTTYHYRVVATNAEGIAKGKDQTFTTKADPRFSFAFGSGGSGNGQFSEVAGIEIDASGNPWVVDPANERVQKFNSKGEYVSQFNGGPEQWLAWPHGIEIDASGNLWIADTMNQRIAKFNSKGEYQSQFGEEGEGNGQLVYPFDLAIDSSGNFWVADTYNNRIQKFNSKGEYVAQVGKEGNSNGQLIEPAGIATDSSGNVWVADTGNNRIQKFSPGGEFLAAYGKGGSANGQFSQPQGIEIDASGNVWVTDTGNDRVQKLSSSGEYLAQFGTPGSGAGQFSEPTVLTAGSSGSIWVGDNGRRQVQKWVP